MKLIFCHNCLDVFSLIQMETRECLCGQSKGQYDDELTAWYSGKDAIPLGFANHTFFAAMTSKNDEFIAFKIADNCSTFRRKE